jgi:5-methylcytosine-specific restriction endonuclease McrA
MRTPGKGAMFYAKSSGLWIGQRELQTDRGEKRKARRVSSKTFCGMLAKFSAIDPIDEKLVRSRRENIAAARELGRHTMGEWYAKLRAQKGICFYCGKEGYSKIQLLDGRTSWWPNLVMDHKIPVTRGGSDAIDNIVGACEACNRNKRTMTADEYIRYRNGG